MSIITNYTVVIHLPQISIYAPFNHCAGPIWIKNQKFWLKVGLWWRFKVKFQKQKNVATISVSEGWEDTTFNPFDFLLKLIWQLSLAAEQSFSQPNICNTKE